MTSAERGEKLQFDDYGQSLGLTSQFYFCALPVRLDTYSHCRFHCLYCFAKARGGHRQATRLRVADPEALRRRLDRIYSDGAISALDRLLAGGQPLHLGGMTDPFMPPEETAGVSMSLLKVLADFRHPTVISTKGVLYAREDYLETISRGRFLIQSSISSVDDRLMNHVDLLAPSPSERIEALRRAAGAGIPTSCRIQPVLPTREDDVYEVVRAAAEASVLHVSLEHLKLPIERSWPGTDHLSAALGIDLRTQFAQEGAERIGREWILPLRKRIARVLSVREAVHRAGLSFGAADSDLLLLSDGSCCCSGADAIAGFDRFHRYTFTEAARRGIERNEIRLASIEDESPPSQSIGEFVNSRSRLPGGAGIESYIRANWNGRPNGSSPQALAGVVATDKVDPDGDTVYAFEPWMRDLLRSGQGSNGGIATPQ